MCDEHFSTEIKYICETCNKQICEKCKDSNAHLEHDIKQIITNEVIPESIMDSIKDKENNFKGFKIFEKIYDFYKQDQIRKKIHLKRVMKKIMKIMGKLKKNKMNKKIMKKKILKIKRVKLKMKMQMNKKFKKNLKMI